jgi:O-antigen ligase
MLGKMRDHLIQGKISHFFLLVAIFFLPVYREIFVIALWPWVFFWLIESFIFRKFTLQNFRSITLERLLLPVYFFLLILSLAWTNNFKLGLNEAGRSFMLLLFPIMWATKKDDLSNYSKVRQSCIAFVSGVMVATLILWVSGLIYSISFRGGVLRFNPQVQQLDNTFFYNNFSFLIHPTYFGMMVLLAAILCLNEIKPDMKYNRRNLMLIICGLYFIAILYFVSSRAILLGALFFTGWYVLARLKLNWAGIVIMVFLFVAVTAVVISNPRVGYMIHVLRDMNPEDRYQYFEEINQRGTTWAASFHLIKDHPVFGIGIGDTRNELMKEYSRTGFPDSTQDYLNCHNQFLETWLAAGIPAASVLILILLYPWIGKVYLSKSVYMGFFIICLASFTFESVLSRLWGVAFFSIFYTLLVQRE